MVRKVAGTARLIEIAPNETDAAGKERCKTEIPAARSYASIECVGSTGESSDGEVSPSQRAARSNESKQVIKVARSRGSIDLVRRQLKLEVMGGNDRLG